MFLMYFAWSTILFHRLMHDRRVWIVLDVDPMAGSLMGLIRTPDKVLIRFKAFKRP